MKSTFKSTNQIRPFPRVQSLQDAPVGVPLSPAPGLVAWPCPALPTQASAALPALQPGGRGLPALPLSLLSPPPPQAARLSLRSSAICGRPSAPLPSRALVCGGVGLSLLGLLVPPAPASERVAMRVLRCVGPTPPRTRLLTGLLTHSSTPALPNGRAQSRRSGCRGHVAELGTVTSSSHLPRPRSLPLVLATSLWLPVPKESPA